MNGSKAVARLLVKKAADLKANDENGYTALR
jgi:ankyrin repeat protein